MKKLLKLINQKKARRVVAIAMLFSLSFSMITSGSLILYAEPNQVENTDLENNSTDNNSANLSSSELGETPDFTDLVNQMISGGSDEQGSDEQGSDEQGSDEQGSDEQGSDEQGSDEQGSDEQGSDEQGSDEQGSDEQGSDEQGSDEQGSDEQGSDEQGSDEQGSDEQGSDEQGSDEQGSDEQGSDEQGSDEQGSDEQGSDEQGSDEQGSDEQGSDEQGATDIVEIPPTTYMLAGSVSASSGLMLSSPSEDIEPDYSLTQLVVNAYASYFVDVLYAENPFVSERDINITSDNTKTLSSTLEDIFTYNTYTDKYVISDIPTTEVHPLQSVVDTLGTDWESVLINFINEVYKYNYGDDDTDLETRKAAIHLNYGVDGDYTSMPYEEFKTYFVNALLKALNNKITETTTTVNNKLKLNLRDDLTGFDSAYIVYVNDKNELIINQIPTTQNFYYLDNTDTIYTNGFNFLVLYQKNDITDFKADITSNYISSLFCAYLSCMATANPLYIELYQDGYNFEILYKNEKNIVSKAYVSETGVFITDPVTNALVKTTPIRLEDIFNRNAAKPTDVVIKVVKDNVVVVAVTTGEILYNELQAIYDAIETSASVYAKKQDDGSYVIEYSDHVVPLHWFAGLVDDDTALSFAVLQGNPDLQYIDITEYNQDKLIPGSDISEYITSVNYDFNKPTITFTYALPTSSRYYTTQNVVPERFVSAIRVAITDYYPYIEESAFDATLYNINDYYYISDLGIYVLKDASQKLTKEEYETAGSPDNYISDWYVLSYANTGDSFATCDLTVPFTKPVFNTTSQMWEGSITLDLTECLPLGNYEITITGVPIFNYTQGSAIFSATEYRDVTVVSTDKIVVSGVPSTTSASDITVKFDIVDENNVASTSKYNFYLGDVVIATNANSASVKISNNGNYVVTAKDVTTGYTISATFMVSCFNNMTISQTAIVSGPTSGIGGMNLHWIDAIADTLVQTGMNGVALITMGIFFFVCGAIILLSKYYTKRRFTSVLSVLLVISLAIPYNLGELFAQAHVKYDSNYTSQSPHIISGASSTNNQDNTYYDINNVSSINNSNTSNTGNYTTFYTDNGKSPDFREYITGYAYNLPNAVSAATPATYQDAKNIFTSGKYWSALAYASTGSYSGGSIGFTHGSGQSDTFTIDGTYLRYTTIDSYFNNGFVKWLLYNWNQNIASNGYNADIYTINGGWANLLGYQQLHTNGVTTIKNSTINSLDTTESIRFVDGISNFLKDDSNPINKTDYQTKYNTFTNRISLTPDYETMKYYFNSASNEITKNTTQSYYESRISTQQHNIYKYKERTGSSSGSTIDDPSSAPTVGGTYSRVDRNSDTYTYNYTDKKEHKVLTTTTHTWVGGMQGHYTTSSSNSIVAWDATKPADTVATQPYATYYTYSLNTVDDGTTTYSDKDSVPASYTESNGQYHHTITTTHTYTHTHYTVYGWNSYSDYQYADMGTGSLSDTVSYGVNAYQRSYTELAATRYTWSYGNNKVATHQQYTYTFHADALTKDNTDAILNSALKPTDDSDATALDAWDAVYGNASGAYKTYDADLSYDSGSDTGFPLGGFRRKTNISANTNNSADGKITDVTYGSASASDAVSLGAADLKSKVDAIIDTHTSSINNAHSTQETNILNNWAKPSYWNNILPVHYTDLSNSYNQVYDMNSAGCEDATWPSRTQFIDFMTNDTDENIVKTRNKLYAIYTQRVGCNAYVKSVKTFMTDTVVTGTSNYSHAGLSTTQQYPAPMYLSILIALNGASNASYLYGNISTSGYLRTALYRDQESIAGFEWYNKVAYKLAESYSTLTNNKVQTYNNMVRMLDSNKVKGSTITGTDYANQIIISKKAGSAISGVFAGQGNAAYNLHYMDSAFVVNQGSNSALAYCWSAGQISPDFSNLGTALTIANGSTNNTKQYIYLVAEVDPHTGTPLRVAGTGQSTVRDMLGVLYSALGEAENAPQNILNRTNINNLNGSTVTLTVGANPAATESYYMEHMMGTLINKTATNNSDLSVIHGSADENTITVNEQFNTILRLHTIMTLKGNHNNKSLLEFNAPYNWYNTNGGYELLYFDENDPNSGVIGIKQGNNKYYMYVYKESSTSQSIVFLVKDTPLQNALEVNGNVTETFDPETLVAEGGSKVTQFKPSKGDNGTVNYNAGPTATTLNKCGIGTDEFDYTQETTKQTTPDTTGYNLYSTGVASGIVNQNNASTITYKNLKSGLYTNATSTNVKGATTNANNSRGIVIAEPAISNQAPVNIGNYLVLDVNASLYAKAAMEQFGLFDSYTLYTERNNSSVKGIKDPIDGLSVAFSLNGKVNFQSTYLYTGLDYSTNAHRVNIVRNSDTLLKDVAERRVNVGSEIYIKEHTVKSYLYHIDVQYNIDDNNTISTNTIVTTKVITGGDSAIDQKEYNVQNNNTIFRVDGELTTWACNLENDAANTAYVNEIKSILTNNDFNSIEDISNALGNRPKVVGDEICVGYNRAGRTDYTVNDANNGGAGQFRGFTIVTIAFTKPSITQSSGELWLHEEELNFWYGNMIEASNNTIEWRLKKFQSIAQDVSVIADTVNGMVVERQVINPQAYGTYDGALLYSKGLQLPNSTASVNYAKLNWTPLTPQYYTYPTNIINSTTQDYSFTVYNGIDTHLVISDLTSGYSKNLDDVAPGYYYDEAFNVYDGTGLFAGYRYNRDNNVGRYLYDTTRVMSRSGLRASAYDIYVLDADTSRLGTLITYSFNQVRAFNGDTRNVSALSVGQAPGNVNNYTLNGHTFNLLDYNTNILKTTIGHMWSGYSGTLADKSGIKYINAPYTETVKMKAVNPYTGNTLRYDTEIKTEFQQIDSKNYKQLKDVTRSPQQWFDAVHYTQFYPFTLMTKGNNMYSANNQHSTLVVHNVNNYAYKYTSQDVAKGVFKVKTYDGSNYSLGDTNGTDIYSISVSDAITGVGHYSSYAQVKSNRATITYLPEVIMTTVYKEPITKANGPELFYAATLTMAEKYRKTQQGSMYIMAMKGDHIKGVTYSNASMGGVKGNTGADKNYTYVANGGDFTLKIDNDSVLASLYGYSLDIIDVNKDTTYTMPQNTYNASTGEVHEGSVVTLNYEKLITQPKDGTTNQYRDIRGDWGNNSTAKNADALKNDFIAWANDFMKPDNFGVDANLTLGMEGSGTGDDLVINASDSGLDHIDHYTGFSGSLGTVSSSTNAEAEYVFPLCVADGQLLKDTSYQRMICQIALDYSTPDFTCTYSQAETLFDNSGMKQAILASIESTNSTFNKSQKYRDKEYGALNAQGTWHYNGNLSDEITLRYGEDHWYDEKVKSIVVRRFKWENWHFNDINISDKIDINETAWGTTQLDKNGSGATGKWYLNVFFLDNVNSSLNFADNELYSPNGIYNTSAGFRAKGTLTQAHNAGSVVICNAYVHDWSTNMRSDFKVSAGTSVNDFDE